MKNLKDRFVTERKIYKDLNECLTENITRGVIEAWDDCGFEFTHAELKEALQKVAEEYDVDKHVDWAKEHMK